MIFLVGGVCGLVVVEKKRREGRGVRGKLENVDESGMGEYDVVIRNEGLMLTTRGVIVLFALLKTRFFKLKILS